MTQAADPFAQSLGSLRGAATHARCVAVVSVLDNLESVPATVTVIPATFTEVPHGDVGRRSGGWLDFPVLYAPQRGTLSVHERALPYLRARRDMLAESHPGYWENHWQRRIGVPAVAVQVLLGLA